MSRVKRGIMAKKKHKKILSLTKGYRHGRKKLIRVAKQAMFKAGSQAHRDRRTKKRNARNLWIIKINAGVREHGLTYSKFIKTLKEKNIELDRKILADLAENNPEEFIKIIEKVK